MQKKALKDHQGNAIVVGLVLEGLKETSAEKARLLAQNSGEKNVQ